MTAWLVFALLAVDPTDAGSSELLGHSFGKNVYLGDLVTPRAVAHLKRDPDGFSPFASEQFAERLVDDLIASYAAEHHLTASDAEVKRCVARLAKPGSEDEARKQVIGWKVNHALFEQQHGRLVAHLGGARAVDGLRKLLDEAEKAHQIGFASPRMRAAVLASFDGYDLSKDESEVRAFMSGPKCLR